MINKPEEQTERFTVQASLGSGASGSVYRAYDNVRHATVAIKVLRAVDAGSLFRFKAEFRQLTHISHRNLLQLHELTARDNEWILSMELIEGCDFLRYVRGPLGSLPSDDDLPSAHGAEESEDEFDTLPPEEAARLARLSNPSNTNAPIQRADAGALSLERLTTSLRQLAEGLHALHRADRLHRDLKPANVLVAEQDGRVVICDFGLVLERQAPTRFLKSGPQSIEEPLRTYNDTQVAGTLAYMSPEQASGEALSGASDWYSVGVMLYQALTGLLPFDPRLSWDQAIAARKHPPADPRELSAFVPARLAELSLALLRWDPAQRPGYTEVLAALGERRASISMAPGRTTQLMGREQQLTQLHTAFTRALNGEVTVALLAGRSGMGKSALMQRFITEIEERHGAVVLSGRCYEREDLPYKAIDPLMDALSSRLLQLTDVRAAELIPAGTRALVRMFPVLNRVPAIAALGGDLPEAMDPIEQRQQAFAALRELCRSLSQLGPLLLYIDDLQWGDVDSGPLLAELLRKPRAPGLLLVCAYRSEDEQTAELLRLMRETYLPKAGVTRPVQVVLGALEPDAVRTMAEALLVNLRDMGSTIDLLTREAAGSPLFVRELAAYIVAYGASSTSDLRLERVIEQRLGRLPEHARQLLSIVAVAGRPERRAVLELGAALGANAQSAYRVLEAQQLIQSTGTNADDLVETYHDKIRETAYRMLAEEERVRLHTVLAQAIETRDRERADPDVMLEHFRAAGDGEKASVQALRAAEKAEAAMAFTRAAQLYQFAADGGQASSEETRLITERLASALSLAGRGPDAAEAYLRAIPGASEERGAELRSLATTQLFRAGLLARGFDELKNAERLLGMRVPLKPLTAILMLLSRRLLIRLFGLRLRKAPAAGVTAESRQRMDLLWAIAGSLSPIDQLRGGVYQAEHLLLALRSGDSYRFARALAIEATTWATGNKRPMETQRVLDQCLRIGGASRDPHALSAAWGLSGVCRMLEGRFLEGIRLLRQSQAIQRERLRGALVWDRVITQLFEMRAIALSGDVRELVTTIPELLRDAEARGDLFAAISLRMSHCCWAWLGADQLELARAELATAERLWVQSGYHLQSWYATQAFASIALYEGKVEQARARLATEWKSMFMLRRKIQFTRAEVHYMRGRLDLAAALASGDRSLLASVRKDARLLLAEKAPWIVAHGQLLLACAEAFDDRAAAIAKLYEVEGQFEAVDMKLMAAVCGYRRGQLLLGSEGASIVSQAESAMRKLGVVNVAAFARLLAPGFPTIVENS